MHFAAFQIVVNGILGGFRKSLEAFSNEFQKILAVSINFIEFQRNLEVVFDGFRKFSRRLQECFDGVSKRF